MFDLENKPPSQSTQDPPADLHLELDVIAQALFSAERKQQALPYARLRDTLDLTEARKYREAAMFALGSLNADRVLEAEFDVAETLHFETYDRGFTGESDRVLWRFLQIAKAATSHFRQTLSGYGLDEVERRRAHLKIARLTKIVADSRKAVDDV